MQENENRSAQLKPVGFEVKRKHFDIYIYECMCIRNSLCICCGETILSLLANKSFDWRVLHKLLLLLSFFRCPCFLSPFSVFSSEAHENYVVNLSFPKTLIVTYDANCHTHEFQTAHKRHKKGVWVHLIWINSILILTTRMISITNYISAESVLTLVIAHTL